MFLNFAGYSSLWDPKDKDTSQKNSNTNTICFRLFVESLELTQRSQGRKSYYGAIAAWLCVFCGLNLAFHNVMAFIFVGLLINGHYSLGTKTQEKIPKYTS